MLKGTVIFSPATFCTNLASVPYTSSFQLPDILGRDLCLHITFSPSISSVSHSTKALCPWVCSALQPRGLWERGRLGSTDLSDTERRAACMAWGKDCSSGWAGWAETAGPVRPSVAEWPRSPAHKALGTAEAASQQLTQAGPIIFSRSHVMPWWMASRQRMRTPVLQQGHGRTAFAHSLWWKVWCFNRLCPMKMWVKQILMTFWKKL